MIFFLLFFYLLSIYKYLVFFLDTNMAYMVLLRYGSREVSTEVQVVLLVVLKINKIK